MTLFRVSIGQDSTCRLLALGAIASTLALTAPRDVQAQEIKYDTIVLTGSAAPGTGPGVNFRFLSPPVLNDAGQTVFRASLTGTGVDSSNDRGIFSESEGTLALVAREGSAAPGTGPGVNIHNVGANPILNDAGQIEFSAELDGTGVDNTNNRTIYIESEGALELFVRSGSAAPGTGTGVNFSGFGGYVLNNLGQTAFSAVINGPGVVVGNNHAIFSESGGTLGLVARAGNLAPGAGPGVNFDAFDFEPVLNNAGQTAFRSFLTGTGVDSTNDRAIFSESGGTLHLVARTGNTAPGTGPGVLFSGLNSPVLNDVGQVVFSTFLTSNSDMGIFSESSGTLSLVARTGSAAPGTGPSVNFSGFGPPVLNNAGQTAFSTTLTGTGVSSANNTGIFFESGGTLRLVAREGNAAPGTGLGVNFRSFDVDPVLNDLGQTAFSARLIGTDVNSSNDRGIFATNPAGILQLIAREGNPFDVNPDPLVTENRTVSGVNLVTGSGGSEGRPNSFNDAGQLAFVLSFTDNTDGIFVATFAVPEPESLTLLCMALLVFNKMFLLPPR